MRLSATFELSAKSKQELHGLYRDIFNKIANPKINASQRQCGLRLLRRIEQHLSMYL